MEELLFTDDFIFDNKEFSKGVEEGKEIFLSPEQPKQQQIDYIQARKQNILENEAVMRELGLDSNENSNYSLLNKPKNFVSRTNYAEFNVKHDPNTGSDYILIPLYKIFRLIASCPYFNRALHDERESFKIFLKKKPEVIRCSTHGFLFQTFDALISYGFHQNYYLQDYNLIDTNKLIKVSLSFNGKAYVSSIIYALQRDNDLFQNWDIPLKNLEQVKAFTELVGNFVQRYIKLLEYERSSSLSSSNNNNNNNILPSSQSSRHPDKFQYYTDDKGDTFIVLKLYEALRLYKVYLEEQDQKKKSGIEIQHFVNLWKALSFVDRNILQTDANFKIYLAWKQAYKGLSKFPFFKICFEFGQVKNYAKREILASSFLINVFYQSFNQEEYENNVHLFLQRGRAGVSNQEESTFTSLEVLNLFKNMVEDDTINNKTKIPKLTQIKDCLLEVSDYDKSPTIIISVFWQATAKSCPLRSFMEKYPEALNEDFESLKMFFFDFQQKVENNGGNILAVTKSSYASLNTTSSNKDPLANIEKPSHLGFEMTDNEGFYEYYSTLPLYKAVRLFTGMNQAASGPTKRSTLPRLQQAISETIEISSETNHLHNNNNNNLQQQQPDPEAVVKILWKQDAKYCPFDRILEKEFSKNTEFWCYFDAPASIASNDDFQELLTSFQQIVEVKQDQASDEKNKLVNAEFIQFRKIGKNYSLNLQFFQICKLIAHPKFNKIGPNDDTITDFTISRFFPMKLILEKLDPDQIYEATVNVEFIFGNDTKNNLIQRIQYVAENDESFAKRFNVYDADEYRNNLKFVECVMQIYLSLQKNYNKNKRKRDVIENTSNAIITVSTKKQCLTGDFVDYDFESSAPTFQASKLSYLTESISLLKSQLSPPPPPPPPPLPIILNSPVVVNNAYWSMNNTSITPLLKNPNEKSQDLLKRMMTFQMQSNKISFGEEQLPITTIDTKSESNINTIMSAQTTSIPLCYGYKVAYGGGKIVWNPSYIYPTELAQSVAI